MELSTVAALSPSRRWSLSHLILFLATIAILTIAPVHTACAQAVGADGAAGINVAYEAGTAPYWYIEEQRYGVEYVERGIAQENPALISQGLQIFDWGFAREAADGSFPGSGNGATGEVYHSASLFLEAVARATNELKHYSPVTYNLAPSTYATKIAQYTQSIHQTALWLTGATDSNIPLTLQAYNAPYTHRRFLLAAALQESAILTGDASLTPIATAYIDDGLSLGLPTGWQAALIKNSNGTYPPATLVAPGQPLPTGTTSAFSAFAVNPEANGYDVNYQAVGCRYAECWYGFSTDTARQSQIKTMVANALDWEASRISIPGVIDPTGSSRVGVEIDLTGTVKQLSPTVVRDALLDSLSITNDPVSRIAYYRVNGNGKTVNGTTVAADGAAGGNIAYDNGTSTSWNIGTQRFAADWIDAGVRCANDTYIATGLKMYDWGWAHQSADGSFGTTSSPRFAIPQFIEAASRSILALKLYNPTKYASYISSYPSKIALSANWLAADPFHVMASNGNYVSHVFGVATAFAEAGAVTGNTSYYADAIPYVQQGLSLQLANGEDPENGAADVNWQGISILYLEWFLPYCTDSNLANQIITSIANGLTWEMQYIDVNGDYLGAAASQPIYYAFSNGAGITRNRAFQVVANRIANYSLTDLSAPSTLATVSGTAGTNGWFTSPSVTVALATTDPDGNADVAGTYYTLDGGAKQTYSSSFTVSGAGTHTIAFWSVDQAGNVETVKSQSISIDTAAPSTTGTMSGTQSSSGSYIGSATVTLAASDAISGVGATYYTIDGGAQQTYSSPVVITASHTVQYWSVDVAGNVESQHAISLTIDGGTPSTSAALSGTAGSNGWFTSSSVSVTLTATDPDGPSDIAATYYTLDGGAQQTYTAPFTVSGDGPHSITFWSVDTVGHTETTKSQSINIDTVAPSTTSSVTGTQVALTATDATSGVAARDYTIDGGAQQTLNSGTITVSGVGSHTVTYWSVDVAGNVEASHSITVWIYSIPTITSLSPTTVRAGSPAFVLTITGTGFTPASTVKVDANVLTPTYVSPTELDLTVPSSAVATGGPVSVKVANPSPGGGLSAAAFLNVDGSAPTTTATASGTAGTNGWFTSATVTVTLSAADADGAGDVAATYYTLDGGAQQAYTSPFTVSGDGTHTITFWSVDQIGNVEAANSQSVDIDTVAPSTTSSVSSTNVTLTATDATSGVAAKYYTIDGGPTQTINTGSFSVSGAGSHVVTYWSVDNAGNVESTHSITVGVYPTPSITSISPSIVMAGGPSFTMAIYGTGFTPDTTIKVNSTILTPTYVSQTEVDLLVPSTSIANGGLVSIKAINPTPGGGMSSAVYLTVDGSTPVTSAAVSGTAGTNGWFLSSTATVTLTVTDADGTGDIAATYYTVDGGAQQTYTTPFTVSGDASHTITFWSVDQIGNVEAARSQSVDIDTVAPSTTSSVSGTAVTLTATDATSGVAAKYYSIDGGPTQTINTGSFNITGAGTHTYVYWSVDVAGNVEAKHTKTLTIYPTPAISSISPSTVFAGQPPFTMTITGSGFTTASTVKVNSTILTPTYVSPTQLNLTIPTSSIASAGTVSIKVSNPTPGGGLSNAVYLTVVAISISSVTLNPSTVKGGSVSTGTVTLNGPAPVGGQVISLSTGASKAILSTNSLTIPQGATSGTFSVSTLTVTSNYSAVISAKIGTSTSTSATLTITP